MSEDWTIDDHAPLGPGSLIGAYRVEAPLGEGGMGTVYRATDTKLNRLVAIKMLSDEFADVATRGRFQREAQLASSLNHPHILTVYDVGEYDGRQFLVTEFVDGGTLKDWIKAEKRTPKQIVELLTGVADGLAAAHAAGITHRDIKPANILVAKNGYAKLADFGLAKAAENSEDLDATRTIAEGQTKPGLVVGTVAYMSPEQASGKKLDARSDVFSFGIVLHEMLAGQRPFRGTSDLEVLKTVIHGEPGLLPETSAAFRMIVEKALEKDPAERYQSMREMVVDLRRAGRQKATHTITVPGAQARHAWLPWAVTALVSMAGVGGLYFGRSQPGAGQISFVIDAPPGGEFGYSDAPDQDLLAISPNGQQIAFPATLNGETGIWIRDRNTVSPRSLAGTEGGSSPFWSPDGQSIAFFAGGQLKTIAAAGGPAKTVCQVSVTARTGTWGSGGDILFSDFREGIFRVRSEGGAPALAVAPKPSGDLALLWPQFLPDGKRFFYSALHVSQQNEVWTASLAGGEPKLLMKENSRVTYVPSGYLLFARAGALLAQPFNLAALGLEGVPVVIVAQVQHFHPTGMAAFSASQNGVLAFKTEWGASRVALLDRTGHETAALAPPAAYSLPKVSPDGRQFVVSKVDVHTGTGNLYVFSLAGGPGRQITFSQGDEFSPVWLDNRSIIFSADDDAVPFLHKMALEGNGNADRVLGPSGAVQVATDVLRDGSILYQDGQPMTANDLFLLRANGDGKPQPILYSRANETLGTISPDSRWLAYVSDETGSMEVYVRSYPLLGSQHRISASGGTAPRWSRDGRELYFVDRGWLIARTNPGSEIGSLTRLFQAAEGIVDYDVAPNGQFLANLGKVGNNVSPITVVVGWDAGVKR